MIIEKMKIDHLQDVLKIENELFENPWQKKNFLDEIDNNLAYNIVVKHKDEIIGFGTSWILFENCDINIVAVTKKMQGKKIGEMILNDLIKNAKNKDCEYVFVEVKKSNEVAINLYNKKGFKKVRDLKSYYGPSIDGQSMILDLTGVYYD